ncbi:MAG: DUF4837 family protein [candidate division KSB1 bacterium]|nr:DUF4837 family protein [candidate division KSB1 bacterium]
MKIWLVFALILGLWVSYGCELKKSAIGEESEVVVVADSTLFAAIKPVLQEALEQIILTPQPEKIFTVKYMPPDQLGRAVVRHYILMVGTLDGQDKTSKQVRAMLSEKLLDQVRNGQSFVFRKQEPWAENQLLLVLVAPDSSSLKTRIAENQDYLFDILQEENFRRTEKEMFAQLEQKELEQKLLEKYGWTLRIQHDYIIYREDEKNNFVMLRRTSPERWLFVYWVETDNPDIVTRDWIFKTRNWIGRKYYENDRLVDSLYQVHESKIGERWVLEIDGLWENEEKVAGGPWKAFAFYDAATKRAYLIDIAVFAPGMRKEPFLRQLEVMARSFRTAADLKIETQKANE